MGEFNAEYRSVNSDRRIRSRSGFTICGIKIGELVKLTILGFLLGVIFIEVRGIIGDDKKAVAGWLKGSHSSSSTSKQTGGSEDTENGFYDKRSDTPRPTTRKPTQEPTSVPPTTLAPTQRPTNGCLEDLDESFTASDVSPSDAKIYILQDDDLLNTEELLKCFSSVALGSAGNGDATAEPILKVSEFSRAENAPQGRVLSFALADMLLMDGLKRHPNRVYDPKEANIVIPDLLPQLSSVMPAKSALAELCPSWTGSSRMHKDRMTDALGAIVKSQEWNEAKNRFAFVHAQPLGLANAAETLSPKFIDAIIDSQAMVLTSSTAFIRSWLGSTKRFRNKVDLLLQKVVPVPLPPSSYTIDQPVSENKPVDIFFDDIIRQRKDVARLEDIGYKFQSGLVQPQPSQGILDVNFVRAKQLARSRTCLISDFTGEGNSGLQVMYDGIQSGCMPILLDGRQEVALPFRHSLDWSRSAVFAKGGLGCLMQNFFDIIVLKESITAPGFVQARTDVIRKHAEIFKFPSSMIDYREWTALRSAQQSQKEEQKQSEDGFYDDNEPSAQDDDLYQQGDQSKGSDGENSTTISDGADQEEELGAYVIPPHLEQTSEMMNMLLIELVITSKVEATSPPAPTFKPWEQSKKRKRKRG